MDPISPRVEKVAQPPQERPKLRRGLSAVRIADDKGSVHTYNEEEKQGLVDIVNDLLKDDPQLRDVIPIDPASQDIFDSVHDGVLLCKLVNTIRPRTIEPNKINNKSDLKLFEKLENLTEAVNGAQTALNMPLVNIGVNDLLEGKPVLVLAVLWQLINLHLHTQVARTANIVHLDYLLKDEVDKSIDDEQLRILLRWFNHHLSNAKHPRRVSNLGGDIRDSENYTILLHQLAPKECTLEPLTETDLTKRATLFLDQAARIGCKKFVGPLDIVQGNSRLNFAFLANLFTKFQRPATPPPEVTPSIRAPVPATEIEKLKIIEEKKRLQDEVKAREIQQLQKAIVIAKELMNLPSAEVLQATLAKEERETQRIQRETDKLSIKVENMREKAQESRRETKKAEDEYSKVEQEVTNMVQKHEKEVSQIRTKLDDGVAKVASLKKQLDEAVAQSTKLAETKITLAKEKESLTEKIDVQQKDTNRLTRIRQKLETELSATKLSLTKVQASKVEVEVAITKIEKQIQEINNDIVDINKAILKVDHYTALAKEDLEQEQERVAIVQKEKSRLLERKGELEDEMHELQEKLKEEEETTQKALREEKEKAKEEYLEFVLAADKEIHDLTYKKEAEIFANADILARKDAAALQKIIAKTQTQEVDTELREISRQLRDANTEMLVTEKRNMKLESIVERAKNRNAHNVMYNEIQEEKLNELLKKEREARDLLADKQAETEALEYRKTILAREMEQTREEAIAAELAAASAERDARSYKLEMDVISTLPQELERQRERFRANREFDKEMKGKKEEYKHEKEIYRLERLQEVADREKEIARTLLTKEEERVKKLRQKNDELLVATQEKPEPRRPKIAIADDDENWGLEDNGGKSLEQRK
eukprot:Phypoly_transcript_02061.p1 GENE.Phypoly_transcript_02061~~Phypoly_transcript_02061.p1  ORF type:complete len:884 (+),score=248.22 Phypoly_transcript_02061:36-2687(+)